MIKQSKFVYIIGSIIIGIVSVLGVVGGLILGGVIDGSTHKLTFVSGSLEKTYDGGVLTCQEFVLQEGELKAGHYAKATMTGEQTIAGSSSNLFDVTIYDTNGADVTGDYKITLIPGTLTVSKSPLTITSLNYKKVYDGTVLTGADVSYLMTDEGLELSDEIKEAGYYISSGSLAGNQTLDFTNVGTQKNVGISDNKFSVDVKVTDTNEIVTGNYDITYIPGKLEVLKRPIEIISDDYEMTYDGTPLFGEEFGYYLEEEEMLVEGHEIELECEGSQKNVGVSPNSFTAHIYDGEEDVTTNYEIVSVFGKLEVTKRSIIVTTEGFTREYNGEEHRSEVDAYKITGDGIAENQSEGIVFLNSITNVGRVRNSVNVVIFDDLAEEIADEDVTANYDIKIVEGELIIEPRLVKIKTADYSHEYDGQWHSKTDGYEFIEGTSLVKNHTIEPLDWAKAKNAGDIKNEITFSAKEETSNYSFVVVPGTISITPKSATIKTGSESREYNGEPLTNPNYEINGIVNGDRAIVTTTGTITNVGEEKNTYDIQISNADGDATKNYEFTEELGRLEITPRPITLTTGNAGGVYNGSTFNCGTANVSGAVSGHVFTFKFDNEKQVDVIDCDNSAQIIGVKDRTEKVVDVTNYYVKEDECDWGKFKIDPRPIKITIEEMSKTYDGKAFTKGEFEDKVSYSKTEQSESGLVSGHSISYQFEYETQVDVINKKNVVEPIIKDGTSYVTDNYAVELVAYDFVISPVIITINTYDFIKTYDGKKITAGDLERTIINKSEIEERIVDGDNYTFVYSWVGMADAGSKENEITLNVTRGGKSVNENYSVVEGSYGNVTITPRPIKITTNDLTNKTYDGKAYAQSDFNNSVTNIDGELSGHSFIFDFKYGNQVDAISGVSNSIIGIKSINGGVIKSTNYEIDNASEWGRFNINPRSITISTRELTTKTYDGEAYTKTQFNNSVTDVEGEIPGDEFEFDFKYINQVDAISGVKNSVTGILSVNGNTDKAKNYEISDESIYNDFEIKAIKIRIITRDLISKTYNGEAYTTADFDGSVSVYRIDGVSLANVLFDFAFTYEGKADAISAARNTIDGIESIIWNGESISPSNYAIDTNASIFGTFSIAKRQIILSSDDLNTKTYNGQVAYTKEEFENSAHVLGIEGNDNSGILTSIHDVKYTFNYEGQVDATINAQNWFSVTITTKEGNKDVTDNYAITRNFGEFSIAKRQIILSSDDLNTKTYNGQVAYTKEEFENSVHVLDIEGNDNSGILTSIHDVKYTFNYEGRVDAISNAKNQFLVTITTKEGNKDVTNNYAITRNFGKFSIAKRPISITTSALIKTYDGKQFEKSQFEGSLRIEEELGDSGLLNIHSIYYSFLYLNQVDAIVGNVTNSINLKLFFDKNSNGVCDLDYLTKDVDGDGVYEPVDGDTYEDVDGNGVYNGGDTNVTANYDPSTSYGKFEIKKIDIVFQSENESKMYDGQAFIRTKEVTEYIREGESSALLEIGGEQDYFEHAFSDVSNFINAGSRINEFSINIKRGDKDVTHNYNVIRNGGVLTINPVEIELRAEGLSEYYNGSEFSNEKVFVVLGEPIPGEDWEGGEPTCNYKVTEPTDPYKVKLSDITYDIIKVNEDGSPVTNEDGKYTSTKSNYKVIMSEDPGTFEVKRIPIKITTETSSKQYDGQALTMPKPTVEGEILVDIHEWVNLQATGNISGDEIKSVVNSLDTNCKIIIKGTETDISEKYYDITFDLGTLEITKRKITIRTAEETKEYNPLVPLTNSKAEIIIDEDSSGTALGHEAVNLKAVGENDGIPGTIVKNTLSDDFDIIKINEDGEQVSVRNFYDISYDEKYLTVTKIKIKVTTLGDKKEYDGLPLTGEIGTATYDSFKILERHKVELLDLDDPISITDPGTEEYKVQMYVYDEDGEDVTHYYEIDDENSNWGVLEITRRTVTITSQSAITTYNGQPQIFTNYTVSGCLSSHKDELETALPDYIQFKSEIDRDDDNTDNDYIYINGGSSYVNEIFLSDDFTLTNDDGEEIPFSNYYDVNLIHGTVNILRREIEVRSADHVWSWDTNGTVDTCEEYNVANLPDGFEVNEDDITFTGRINTSIVGEVENRFIISKISNEDGEDVTSNFNIIPVYGKLVVIKESDEEIQTASGGSSGKLSSEGSSKPEEYPVYLVNSTYSGKLYLKEKSFGDYEGTKWSNIEVSDENLNMPYNTLSEYNKKITIQKLDWTDKTSCIVPYYADYGNITGIDDGTVEGVWDSDNELKDRYYVPFSQFSYEDIYKLANINAQNDTYYDNIEAYYTELPSTTLSTMETIVRLYNLNEYDLNGYDEDNYKTISKVATFVQNYVRYSFEYSYDSNDYAVTFFTSAKTGICQHYATAATALFRAMGIPARYTVGYVVDAIANTDVTVGSIGHAWVEVYVKGFGWIPVEVTGSMSGSGGTSGTGNSGGEILKPKDVYGFATDVSVVEYNSSTLYEYYYKDGSYYTKYDGNEEKIDNDGFVFEGEKIKELLSQNPTYSFKIRVSGRQTGVGKSASTIIEYGLYDNDTNITSDYKFDVRTGTLQIYLQKIYVATGSEIFQYNGIAQQCLNYKVSTNEIPEDYEISGEEVEDGALMEGHSISISPSAYVTNVGERAENNISKCIIVDEQGNDVTSMYYINYSYGEIGVKQKDITIKIETTRVEINLIELQGIYSGMLTYDKYLDKNPDKEPNVDAEGLGLAPGDTISISYEGYLQKTGYTSVKVTITVTNAFGNVVTDNYHITCDDIILLVTP